MIQSIIANKANRLFLILGGFFIANALIAEIIGVKIFSLEQTFGFAPLSIVIFGNELSFNLTAGVLLWPVVFIMTDLINEYYGRTFFVLAYSRIDRFCLYHFYSRHTPVTRRIFYNQQAG
jgi:uncharacterized PurR-regulated membrane protein YhhQ (DUF165 family)